MKQNTHQAGSPTIPWIECRLFISSTFKDFHGERDYLHTQWLPRLQQELADRKLRVHVELVDLRQGVDTLNVVTPAEVVSEEEVRRRKDHLVLKYCLDAVEHCRPFFIALLGDRYGWIAPLERTAQVAREKGLQIPEDELKQTSVTALEVGFGVSSDLESQRRVRIYLRESLPYDELVASHQMQTTEARDYSDAFTAAQKEDSQQVVAAHNHTTRLNSLKERLRQTLPDRVHSYRGRWGSSRKKVVDLEEWGDQFLDHVLTDLQDELRDSLARQSPTPLEDFVEYRRRGFLGRADQLGNALALVRSPTADGKPWGLCLTGSPGAGKSSFFAELYNQLRQDDEVFLLAHAAGSGPDTERVEPMLRDWVEAIAADLGVANPLTAHSKPEEVEQAFAGMLTRVAAHRRVVLMLDAIDQMEATPRARNLSWLPRMWPANARLVATTVPGTASDALRRKQGVILQELRPLDVVDEAALIAERFYRVQGGGTLNPTVREVLLDHQSGDGQRAAGSPLWLRLAIDELTTLDADDFARFERNLTKGITDHERGLLKRLGLTTNATTLGDLTGEVRHYLMLLHFVAGLPADVPGLYQHMLERAEEVVGRKLTTAFATLIALSRFGWRESDLRPLLSPHMDNGTWNDLRFAQLRRCFRSHLVRRGSAGQYDFFHAQMRAAVQRRYLTDQLTEVPWHAAIADHLEGLPPHDPLRISERMFHLIKSRRTEQAAAHLADAQGAEASAAQAAVLARHLEVEAVVEEHFERILGQHPPQDARTASLVQMTRGKMQQAAMGWLVDYLDQESLSAQQRLTLAQTFQNGLRKFFEPVTDVVIQLHLVQLAGSRLVRLASEHPHDSEFALATAQNLCLAADLIYRLGDLRGVGRCLEQCLNLCEPHQTADGDPRWRRIHAGVIRRVGDGEFRNDRRGDAWHYYREAIRLYEALQPLDPELQRDLAFCYLRSGDFKVFDDPELVGFEFYDKAASLFAAVIAAENQVRDRMACAVIHDRRAQAFSGYMHYRDEQSALREIEISESHWRELLREFPENPGCLYGWSLNRECLGDWLAQQSRYEEAFSAYQEVMMIREQLLDIAPSNGEWLTASAIGHYKCAFALRALGERDKERPHLLRTKSLLDQMEEMGVQLDFQVSMAKLGLEGLLAAHAKPSDALPGLDLVFTTSMRSPALAIE